jgi:hypothetical protein
MIFKRTINPVIIEPGYQKAAQNFTFGVINDLVYTENLDSFKNLQEKFRDGNRLYPDLIAALYRKMYEYGLTQRPIIINSLLACSHYLQNKNFKFLGFIRKDDEVDKNTNIVDFFSEWDFEANYYKLKLESTEKESKEPLSVIFEESDFQNSYNVFFVAGSQSVEMLDLRIKKAAILISCLVNANYIESEHAKIILSGWNNAKVGNSKVQFANESLTMRNLLIHKLAHYIESNLDEKFINEKIESEINSRDTSENIEELIKKLDNAIKTAKENGRKNLNLFIVSSTFHLLQLSDHILKKESALLESFKQNDLKPNLYLVGTENPNHFFKIYDKGYIKLLINEVIHRNFKFCR